MLRVPKVFHFTATFFRILYLIVAAVALFWRFTTPKIMLGFYQDDFFYYLKIVQNLATHGISSFDGIHLTNGYHPLWILLMLVLYKLLPGISFFVGIQLLTLVAASAFYLGMEQVLRLLSVAGPLCPVLTFMVALQALLLFRYGMEITLALPLAAWLIFMFLRTGQSTAPYKIVGLGLLAAVTVLARLDAVLLVFLLFAGYLLQSRGKGFPRWSGWFLAGFLPLLLVYFGVNYHLFHTLMPVSGQAKQLKIGLWPSPRTIISVFSPLDRMKLIFLPACLVLFIGGFICAPRGMRGLPKNQAAVLWSLLLFPVVHLSLLSILSDWTIWPWYYYPFVLSSLAGCAILARALVRTTVLERQTPVESRNQTVLQFASLFASCLYLIYLAAYCIVKPNSILTYEASAKVASFMDDHPGIYAMGDQAGATAYLAHEPIIQLEGLTMDKTYLGKIRHREPLRQILSDYGARYYVTLPGILKPQKCLHVREPAQAGPSSPVSTGVICVSPLATYYRADHQPIEIFPAAAIR